MATKEMVATQAAVVSKPADRIASETPPLILTPAKRNHFKFTKFTTDAKFEKELKNTNDVDGFINLATVDDDKDLQMAMDFKRAKDLNTVNLVTMVNHPGDDGEGEGLPDGEGGERGEGLQDGGDDGDPYNIFVAESQMYPGPVSRYAYDMFATGFLESG